MSNFFDRFKPGGGGGGGGGGDKDKNGNGNPLAGWFQKVTSAVGVGNTTTSFSGQGQSLGGAVPGAVIPVTLSDPGSLGIQIEKSTSVNSAKQPYAIIARVVPDSQAATAGLQRGDIICFAGSHGREEVLYDMFLELATSTQRPLCFEVRRVPQTKSSGSGSASANGAQNNGSASASNNSSSSAEAFARRQAVIAAAEKRESAHKKLVKPLPKKDVNSLPKLASNAERLKLEQERRQKRIEQDDEGNKELSAATKAALEQAKNAERATVHALGYNPYESKSLTSGQARNAVTTTTHGSMAGGEGGGTNNSSSSGSGNNTSTPVASSQTPTLPSAAAAMEPPSALPSLEFEQAFETTVTSTTDHDAVVTSIGILRKLIINATTKGQQTHDNNDDEASKFRKVRLANPKIQAAVTDMVGAVDLLLSVGFQLHSEDNESILVYPPHTAAPAWLANALQQMERYTQA